jgi:carotenoid cleavage dioxygenase
MKGNRSIVRSAALSRRTFLKSAGVFAASLSLPGSFLVGCGNDDGSAATPGATPLQIDPTTAWWLQNNHGPVFDELDAFDLPVRGRIPSELNGLYVRNGSNPQDNDSTFWFFGDGMLHGVRLEDGRAVWYRNRYIRTPLYQEGISGSGGLPIGGNNQSNVSAIYHAGRLLTSGEVGFPHEIDPSDLSTIGAHSFEDKLNTSFTAHPKIDPATGWMHFFGYWFVPPYLTYHVADETGRIIHSAEIEVGASTMIHSFAITERDVVFWECPVLFDLAALADEGFPFRWQPEYGSRIGIMPLGGTADEIRWVEMENCYVFHELNAYRDGDDVVINVCRLGSVFDGDLFAAASQRFHRWRVHTAGEQLRFRDEVAIDRRIDFPVHDRRFTGRRNRYGWFVHFRPHDETIDNAGVTFVDFETGRQSDWDPGPTRHADEPFFVPRGPREGDGWLLSFVYDHATDTSDLVVLDAMRVQNGPVAEIRMPRRVPEGFHGVWVPS